MIKSAGYLSLILGIVLPTTVNLATISPQPNNLVISPKKISLNFPDVPDGEPPTSTAGGGTRGTIFDTPTGEPRGILLSSPDCSVFMELPPTVSRIISR